MIKLCFFSYRVFCCFSSFRYYRSLWRNYRWNVPDQLPKATSAYKISVLLPSGSGTGTCSDTTALPEVPDLFPEVPVASAGPTSGATSVYFFRYWPLVFLTGSLPGSGSGSTGSIGTTGPFSGTSGLAGVLL